MPGPVECLALGIALLVAIRAVAAEPPPLAGVAEPSDGKASGARPFLSRVRWNVVLAVLCLAGLCLTRLHSHLLFHSLAEGFSIVVAGGMFMLAWNSRRFLTNHYLLFVGVAYLFIAGLDLIHTLAYPGMGIFTEYGSDLGIQLWIGARCVESLTLLIAPFMVRRRLNAAVLLAVYAGTSGLVLASLFAWPVFPSCYHDETGLTAFKVLSELVICVFLLASVLFLFQRRTAFAPGIFHLLVASVVCTILSELAFTLYTEPTQWPNVLGHILKIVSFYLIYKAIIENGLVRPYDLLFRELSQGRDALATANAKLEANAEELERSNAELEQFAYVASHDLREPLRTMSGYVQLLERRYKDKLDDDARDFIGFVVDGAERMQQLISDLLVYARVNTRGKPLVAVDCQAVLERALEQLKTAIAESGAVVTHDPMPTAMGDASQLAQLLQNLLSNAVKFRGDKSPRIHVSARRQNDEWVFGVADNGIGIDPKHAERVFAMFQRLHGRGEYGGTGIGLAVSKKIVERHGGRIWLESQEGQGATFYFTLPAAVASEGSAGRT